MLSLKLIFYYSGNINASSQHRVTRAIKSLCCSTLQSRGILTLLGCVLLILYSVLGAAIFMVVEGGQQGDQNITNVTEIRTNLLSALSSSEDTCNVSKFELLLQRYESDTNKINCRRDSTAWNFWESLFFATTVYTTIGYGHIAPVTNSGRIATIVYAIFGIPMFLVVIASVGRYIPIIVGRAWYCILRRKVIGIDNPRKRIRNVIIAILAMLLYMLTGVLIYTRWEKWNYFEAFYFLFISFTTIGFGDITPEHPKIFLLTSPVYILIGLTIMSMCIDLVVKIIIDFVRKNLLKVSPRDASSQTS
ncbi:hypothetical protein ACJMK2_006044 [Sinanodonta woodiana]|uniref:Potassium channel domain-containing protein n=1 Tax=Sinanodonta woodiana TaxID=1069815 RepID=A0ABD3VRX8_SINWO